MRESPQSDATANHLNRQFQSLFASFSGQIARVDPTVTASFAPSATSSQSSLETSIPAEALEHYSGTEVNGGEGERGGRGAEE